MARKKKQAMEMTTEETARRLFPKKVIHHVKKTVSSVVKSSIKPKSK